MSLLVYKPRLGKAKLKSPLKNCPLRNPGQSLELEIHQLKTGRFLDYFLYSSFTVVWATVEWMHWYVKSPPNPSLAFTVAFIVMSYSSVKMLGIKKKMNSLKLGRDGEKAVGQYLESLRETGAKVFHDIPGTNFNIDHVVVSTSGIYMVETKTYSKPAKGETKILFNGDSLIVNNKPTDKPLIQVQAASKWLKLLLEESTGNKYLIKPVILFPGWYIETTYEAKSSDIWVLNPKGLPTFIANSKAQLSPEQVKMIAFHLSRYVRTFQENK